MAKRKKETKSRRGRKPETSMPEQQEGSRIIAAIQKARIYLDRLEYDKALNLTQPLWGKISPRDQRNFLNLCRILAFSSANVGQLDKAITYARAGLRETENNLDFNFILAIVAAMQADFDKTIEFSEKYETIVRQNKPANAVLMDWDQSIALRHQLLNAYGVALLERGLPDKAERVLQEAMRLKSDYDSTYINLSILYRSRGDEKKAEEMENLGKNLLPKEASSSAVHEETDDSSGGASISVCMIVKNEEFFLPRCLKSIRNVADEIILVDTGSEDLTVEIAREFGCRIYHFPWQGDFSSARNESLRYATKDWIFIIDADEELPKGEDQKIRYFVGKPDHDIISISVYSKSLETGSVSSFLPSVRLFKRELGLQFEGIVHNRLNIKLDTEVSRCNVKLYHYGYDISRDKLENKLARSKALLEKQIEENPDDIFAHFNMAQLLRGTKDAFTEATNRLIVQHAEKVVNHPEAGTDKYFGQYVMAHHQAANAYFNLKEYAKCEQFCRKAVELKPDYLDPLLSLGNTYCAINRFIEARKYYQLYLEGLKTYNPETETHNIIMIYLEHQHIAWYGLGVIAQCENRTDEAIEFYENTVKAHENYLDSYMRLGRLYLDKNWPERAAGAFKKYLKLNQPSAEAYFGMGEAFSKKGQVKDAVEQFGKAVEIDPNNIHIRYRLARSLLNIGNEDAGLEYLIMAAEGAGDDYSFILDCANLLFEFGYYKKASEYYLKVLDLNPNHGDTLNNLANCYFKSGDLNRATDIYRQIIDLNPEYQLAYRNLGLTYFKLDDYEKALHYLNRYHDKQPNDSSILRIKGDIGLKLANYTDAIGAYEQYLNANPGDTVGWLNLADAYLHLGYGDAAILGYQKVLSIDPGNESARDRIRSLAASVTSV